MGYIGGWNSQQKINRICWTLGGEYCLRLFNIVIHEQRERERERRANEAFMRQLMESIKNRRLSHGSCCTPVDIKKLFNSDACDDDDDDYSHFFQGLDLEVAS
jgi:hypothetical protein